MNIHSSLTELIGNTPLLRLQRYRHSVNARATLLAKLECFNPAGSVKDRAALYMLNDAEQRGVLSPGGTIIEPTSGNTGVGLASIAVPRGYTVILTMPDTMSVERRSLLRAYGAQLVLTPGKLGMSGAIAEANRLAQEIPDSVILSQFSNAANSLAHFKTTAPEIWEATDGKLHFFVCGVGTGGTITGVGRYLKGKNRNIKIVAVEPSGSPVLSGKAAGPHGIMGIGAGFVPEALDLSVIDEIITVSENDAYGAARQLSQTEGLLVGISSGAALFAATQIAKREESAGKIVTVVLPDTGERYLSTPLYGE